MSYARLTQLADEGDLAAAAQPGGGGLGAGGVAFTGGLELPSWVRLVKLQFTLKTAGAVAVRLDETAATDSDLEGGSALAADSLYAYDVLVRERADADTPRTLNLVLAAGGEFLTFLAAALP